MALQVTDLGSIPSTSMDFRNFIKSDPWGQK